MDIKIVLQGKKQTTEGIQIVKYVVENMTISESGEVCLISPNETKWKLTVDDSGILSTEEVTE